MIDVFKTILEVAKSLLGMSDQLRAADRQRRQDLATLLEQISTTLAEVSSEIRLGRVPYGKCSEVKAYADKLPDKVRLEIGETEADELGRTLLSAYDVEGMAIDLQDNAEKEPHLQVIEEASGKFRALANIMRAV